MSYGSNLIFRNSARFSALTQKRYNLSKNADTARKGAQKREIETITNKTH